MAAWVFLIDVLHHSVSSAEFSPDGVIQDYCMARLSKEYMAVDSKSSSHWMLTLSKARFHVTVRTHINKSVVYFIVRRNVKFGCSEC